MPTRWHPDTCTCIFDVADDWKSATPVRQCDRHAKSPAIFDVAIGDNRNKNAILGKIADELPRGLVNWSYAADGTLHIAVRNASAALRANIMAVLPNAVIEIDPTLVDLPDTGRG